MDLADLCYEAAFVPERWDSALGGICAASGSGQAAMIFFNGDATPINIGFNIPGPRVTEFEHAWRMSPAVRWGLTERPAAFTTFRENLSAELLTRDPAVTMLHDQGYRDHAVSVQSLGQDRTLGILFARPDTKGHFDATAIGALDAMRPHLVRAGLVAARLELERARTTVETLDRLGLAAAVLDGSGRVLAVNAALEAMPDAVRPGAFGGARLADHFADQRLRDALARIAVAAPGARLSIPMRTSVDEPRIVHLVPVRGEARDMLGAGNVVMIVAALSPRAAPDLALLQGLFDLTRAEARLSVELLRGGSLTEIAARTGLSHHTLRVQLRAVMAKTGTHRQAELCRLLGAL